MVLDSDVILVWFYGFGCFFKFCFLFGDFERFYFGGYCGGRGKRLSGLVLWGCFFVYVGYCVCSCSVFVSVFGCLVFVIT